MEPPRLTEHRRGDVAIWPWYLYVGLVVKYIGIVGYGIHSAIVGVPTIGIVIGWEFQMVWPVGIATFAAAALVGTIRSWGGRGAWLEIMATTLLLLLFVVYSATLAYRAVALGSPERGPSAWLPMILTIFPAIRYLVLVANLGGDRAEKRRRNRR